GLDSPSARDVRAVASEWSDANPRAIGGQSGKPLTPDPERLSQGVMVGRDAREVEPCRSAPKVTGRVEAYAHAAGAVAAGLCAGIRQSPGSPAPYRVEHHVVELDNAGRGEDAGGPRAPSAESFGPGPRWTWLAQAA